MNNLKFVHILHNLYKILRFKNGRTHLKIYIRCINWNTSLIAWMKKCHMDRRQYESRHLVPMFLGHPVHMHLKTHICWMFLIFVCFKYKGIKWFIYFWNCSGRILAYKGRTSFVYHYGFSRSTYFHLLIAPIEGFITLIG